jgi:hypothetical protein
VCVLAYPAPSLNHDSSLFKDIYMYRIWKYFVYFMLLKKSLWEPCTYSCHRDWLFAFPSSYLLQLWLEFDKIVQKWSLRTKVLSRSFWKGHYMSSLIKQFLIWNFLSPKLFSIEDQNWIRDKRKVKATWNIYLR